VAENGWEVCVGMGVTVAPTFGATVSGVGELSAAWSLTELQAVIKVIIMNTIHRLYSFFIIEPTRVVIIC
jgi:hypothetical protein